MSWERHRLRHGADRIFSYVNDAGEPQAKRAYVLGGNASTLAFVTTLVPANRQITAWLVPLAWTPIGAVLGDGWQRVNIAADNIGGWVDQTFPPEDDRAFVTSMRDLEILAKVGWAGGGPLDGLGLKDVLNVDDLPDDVLDALDHPAEPLTTCAICRRSCVRGHFVWNERQLCAWDFHLTVFGKRGPWHDGVYEEKYFVTLPAVKYVAHGLLDEVGVDAVVAAEDLSEPTLQAVINTAIADTPDRAHLAVRTESGLTLLRERISQTPSDRS